MSRKGSTASSNGLPAKGGGHGDGGKDKEEAEMKAAYVVIIGDITKDVTSKNDFEKVLQQAGRNPSQKTIDQHWTKDTKKITFKEVEAIVQELKPTTEDELLKAFKKIDVNGDGYITQKELSKVLTQRGDKMSEKEVEDMIAEADKDGDRKLNYTEFCKMVMSTTSKCQETSLKRMERKERKQKRALKLAEKKKLQDAPSSASTKKKEEVGVVLTLPPISGQQASQKEPANIKDWYHAQSRGCFYFDDEQKIVSHQYVLDVDMTTKLWLTIKPIDVGNVKGPSSTPKTDLNLFVLKQSRDGIVGDVVTFTRVKNKETYCVQGELSPGTYRFIPMTTGCHFRPRTRTVKEKTILIQPKGSEECELTTAFKSGIDAIFDMVDLDGNGTLSRHEFNIFQLRTSGEAVDDDTWEVMEENFELEKGEVTRKGFMDLNHMEANDGFAEGGQVDELWVNLSAMGFAEDLVLDEACPFLVDAYTEHCPATMKTQPLQRGGPILQKAICQSVINAGGFTRAKTVKDMKLYTYMGDGRVTFVVENKAGSKKCGLKLDCSKSKNCLLNPTESTQTVQCYPGVSAIAFHLVPEDEDKEWTIDCQEELMAS